MLKSTNQVRALMKLMNNAQSDLLQAQVELQESQHIVQNVEDIIKKSDDLSKLNFKTYNKIDNQYGDVNAFSSDYISNKKTLDNVLSSNKVLTNELESYKKEILVKDKILFEKSNQIRNLDLEKSSLENSVQKLRNDTLEMNKKYLENIETLKNKYNQVENKELVIQKSNSELQSQLTKLNEKLELQEKILANAKEMNKKLNNQLNNSRTIFQNEFKNYEVKVRTIIEELKIQKNSLEDDTKILIKEIKGLKINLKDLTEQYREVTQQLQIKDSENNQLKTKLADKCQMEEREKLIRRELEDCMLQLTDYKNRFTEMNSEKEKYYSLTCEQDNTICQLLDEIRTLQNKKKDVRDEEYSMSSAIKINQSIPETQSSEYSNVNYPSSYVNKDFQYTDKKDNNIILDYESPEENPFRKLPNMFKSQAEDNNEFQNSNSFDEIDDEKDECFFVGINEFSRYLETQLQIIKEASERNIESIKRELTIR